VYSFIRKHFDWSMLRWALVGVSTFIIDYSIFITLYGPIESVFIANFVAAVFATSFNYFMHHKWTFKSEQDHKHSTVKYLLTLIFWWFVGTSLLKLLIVSGLDPRLAKFIPVLVVTPFNYFVLNYLVFRKIPYKRSTRPQ
jgi:putative flippase GtrA